MEVLENRKIVISPIIRKRAFFPKGHDGEHTYTGCHKDYGLPISLKRRAYLDPFFNKDEQAKFEELLNLKPGSLNLYDLNSKFWGDFSLSLTKEGEILDLNNPVDALWYRVLLVNPRFANNESQRSNQKCDFILIDKKEEQESKNKNAALKEEAIDYFTKIKGSKQKLYDTLRLLNKKPDKDATIEALKAKILEIIEEPISATSVTNIGHFLKIIKDPTKDLKLFILDAVDAGEIELKRDGFRIKDNGEFIGKHLEQAVNYFNTKDADVLEIKAIIEQRIKN
jgi:hypothetical protein